MSRNDESTLADEIMAELDNPAWAPQTDKKTARNTEFYHGTGRTLSPGDHVLPWSRLKDLGLVQGEAPHGGAHMAWAADRVAAAKSYGKNVYKVKPLGEHEVIGDGRIRSEHGFEVINDWWKD